jgi:uncharacterized membrane protein
VTALGFGLTLAAAASLALNAGYLLQHLGGAAAPSVDLRRPVATVRGLLGSRLWVAGTAIGLAGSVLHAGALAQAPLTLVQAFAAAGLAVLVPVAARVTRTRLRRSERVGVALIVTALAALAVRPAAAALSGPPALAPLLGVDLAAALVAIAGRRAPAVLGVATGVLYGVADASIKAFAETYGLVWPAVFAGSCAIAFFAFQRALQKGSAVTVVALMTAGLNVTSVLAGLALFGERLGASTPVTCMHALAMGAAGLGAWWLTRAQARITPGGARTPAS